jgi:hypothetical protein
VRGLEETDERTLPGDVFRARVFERIAALERVINDVSQGLDRGPDLERLGELAV